MTHRERMVLHYLGKHGGVVSHAAFDVPDSRLLAILQGRRYVRQGPLGWQITEAGKRALEEPRTP